MLHPARPFQERCHMADAKKDQKFTVGQKVKTKDGEFEVVAVNDDGSCECKCCETGERKLLTQADLEKK